ncbi:competence type IV pilus minor pilin ComGF [Paenilisteria weihenstephanensis]|nr:competence type IV pilus minor pilin ComGF [Listeria weihenstephanensis]
MLSNKEAFTLLESLFSLLILIIVTSFIPLIFQSYQSVLKVMDVDKNYEWQLFMNQTRKEIYQGTGFIVTDHAIIFSSQSKQIKYEGYQNMVRRSVDNKGHEPLLTTIKQDKWTKTNDGRLIYEVTFEDNIKLIACFYVQEGGI